MLKMQSAKLAAIHIYPFKSLPSIECTSARFLSSGALVADRAFAFFRLNGSFFNAKSDARIHQIRMKPHADLSAFEFSFGNEKDRILIDPQSDFSILEDWLYERLGLKLIVKTNRQSGFPDDIASPGPTIISTATIESIADWFPHLSPQSIRSRLRTNLEITAVPPFWEDVLCGKSFRIGAARLEGTGICQRCVVPSRDPITGKATPHFVKHFQKHRQSALPDGSPADRFDHFYRVAINTKAPNNSAQTIRLGDPVALC